MIVAYLVIGLALCFMFGWFMASGNRGVDRSSIRDFIAVDQYLKVDDISRNMDKNTPSDSLDLHQNIIHREQSYTKDSTRDQV